MGSKDSLTTSQNKKSTCKTQFHIFSVHAGRFETYPVALLFIYFSIKVADSKS